MISLPHGQRAKHLGGKGDTKKIQCLYIAAASHYMPGNHKHGNGLLQFVAAALLIGIRIDGKPLKIEISSKDTGKNIPYMVEAW